MWNRIESSDSIRIEWIKWTFFFYLLASLNIGHFFVRSLEMNHYWMLQLIWMEFCCCCCPKWWWWNLAKIFFSTSSLWSKIFFCWSSDINIWKYCREKYCFGNFFFSARKKTKIILIDFDQINKQTNKKSLFFKKSLMASSSSSSI